MLWIGKAGVYCSILFTGSLYHMHQIIRMASVAFCIIRCCNRLFGDSPRFPKRVSVNQSGKKRGE